MKAVHFTLQQYVLSMNACFVTARAHRHAATGRMGLVTPNDGRAYICTSDISLSLRHKYGAAEAEVSSRASARP